MEDFLGTMRGIWQAPMELKSWLSSEDEGKEWNTHLSFFTCRYHHFRDFIGCYAANGLPDDASPEFKKELEEWDAVRDISRTPACRTSAK